MKKREWFFFAICLLVFSGLRFCGVCNKKQSLQIEEKRISLPHAARVSKKIPLGYPWVAQQSTVKEHSIEITRDLEALREIVAMIGKTSSTFSEEKIAQIMIETLLQLQKEVPFNFPEGLYNVLCIPDSADCFQVHQRLYLGDGDLGFPHYLDVRVFSLADQSVESIIERHKETLCEEAAFFLLKEGDVALVGRGMPEHTRGHGFSQQQELGVFIYPVVKDARLYLCYAEAPWDLFEKKYLKVFSKIALNSVKNETL